MKIVDQKVWFEFTCNVCGSTCQADPEDTTGIPNTDSDGDKVGAIPVVACGYCGCEHTVPAAKRTPKIERLAAERCRK